MGIESPNPIIDDNFEEENSEVETDKTPESEKPLKKVDSNFKRKIKNVANAMMLASALSAVPGVVKSAEAGQQSGTKIEDVQKEKINEANLTESGTWARDLLNSAQADVNKLKTAEDAEWFVRRQVGGFIMEWHQPTKGTLETDSYSLKHRVSTDEDLDLVLESARKIDKILDEVNAKFHVPSYENKKGDLDRMIKSYENQTSYAGKQQRKALEDAMKNR